VGFASGDLERILKVRPGFAQRCMVERLSLFEPLGSGLQGFHCLTVVPFGRRDRCMSEKVADLGQRHATRDEA
jgi:hypothetical protein